MENIYTYKKQKDGRDSWVCEEPDGNRYMVYEDPSIKDKTDLKAILSSATEDEIEFIKQLLK